VGPEDRQFPEFFASQYGRLRRLGFLLTGDWGEGDELAQETLVRIYWRWSLVCRQEHPEAYARKVLVNRHRSLLRRLRLEARHAGRDRAEASDLGPREDGTQGPAMRALAQELVDSIRPITNALPPQGSTVAEEPGTFAGAPVVVGRGGQGDHAWEVLARKGSDGQYWVETRRQNGDLLVGELFMKLNRSQQTAWIECVPSKERVMATLVSGLGSEAVTKVVLEVGGRSPVEVPTFRKDGFPFAFWVVAPLPPDARPLAFTSFDAAGQRIARRTPVRR